MDFVVVDTNGYDVLLSLDFLINIGGVVDIEQQLIQICHRRRVDVQVLLLNMVNMLQWMDDHLIFELQSTQIQDQLKLKLIQGKGNLGQGLQYELFQPYEKNWFDFELIDDYEEDFDANVGDNKFRLILQEERKEKWN